MYSNTVVNMVNYIRSNEWVSDQIKTGLAIAGGVSLDLLPLRGIAALAIGVMGSSRDEERRERMRVIPF